MQIPDIKGLRGVTWVTRTPVSDNALQVKLSRITYRTATNVEAEKKIFVTIFLIRLLASAITDYDSGS